MKKALFIATILGGLLLASMASAQVTGNYWRPQSLDLTPIISGMGLLVPGLASSTTGCLSVASNGYISANGSACGSGGGSSFGKSWEEFGNGAWLAPTTTIGIIVNASSTIGNGTATGGLTVSGTATTSNLIDTVLTNGDCVQAGLNGLLTSASAACGSGGGSNPFTNPTPTSFATTSGMVINNASSTFVGNLLITGNSTTTNATTTALYISSVLDTPLIKALDGLSGGSINIDAGNGVSPGNSGGSVTITGGTPGVGGKSGGVTLEDYNTSNGISVGNNSGGGTDFEPFIFDSTSRVYLDASGVGATPVTMTFPNESGTLALGTGTTGDCAQWSDSNTLAAASAACGSGSPLSVEIPSGTIDGTNKSFTVVNTPVDAIFLNGAYQTPSVDVTISGTSVTFTNAPVVGSNITSMYGGGANSLIAYPFPLTGNATSTLTQFNGGITAFASTTIGNGTLQGGLTVNGGATTTNLVTSNLSQTYSGLVSPFQNLTIPFGTSTATWTASSSAGVDVAPAIAAPFTGKINRVWCNTNSFLGVEIDINGSPVTPPYFIASSTVGDELITANNTFTAGNTISAKIGTTTSATVASGVVSGSCTIQTTETP